MNNRITPIKYTEHLCFKCLKEHNNIHKYEISNRGYGSGFDGENTLLQLCDKCNNNDLDKWFNEIPKIEEYWEVYKYEYNIFNFIKTLPLQGRELFENQMSTGACAYNIDSQEWLDIELNIAPDEVYKRNGMYSPSEIKAYHDRFPTCDKVYLKTYSDKSVGCLCAYGAFGNKDGTCEDNIWNSCYTCKTYKKKNIDDKLKEVKDFMLSKDELKEIKMYEWTCPKCGEINHTYSYEDNDYCNKCDSYVDFDI